jgi:glycosyltransferase involved in cell wall biosynthesis
MMQLEFSDIQILVLVIFVLGILAQSAYYLFFFSKLAFYKKSQDTIKNSFPISVLISARNEYENLEKNLRAILEQDYSNFEVIVVNDCSWDDSQKLLEYYQEQFSNLKICTLIEQEKYPTGKKFALTIGIKAAVHEHLVFTDADCMPASNQWLQHMANGFQSGKEIVLGYSPYKVLGGLLNLFIRFEGAVTGSAYFSAAISKNSFMGVGRNLAYTKSLFFKHKGFAGHQHILSGDDDLFINDAANSNNVQIQIHPDSFVFTDAKKTFESWSRQKSRHVSTGKYYKIRHQVLLGGFYSGLLFFYVGLGLSIGFLIDWRLVLSLYSFKLLVQFIFSFMAFKKLGQKNLTWFIPLLDVLYVFYIYIFGLKGLFTKKRKIW